MTTPLHRLLNTILTTVVITESLTGQALLHGSHIFTTLWNRYHPISQSMKDSFTEERWPHLVTQQESTQLRSPWGKANPSSTCYQAKCNFPKAVKNTGTHTKTIIIKEKKVVVAQRKSTHSEYKQDFPAWEMQKFLSIKKMCFLRGNVSTNQEFRRILPTLRIYAKLHILSHYIFS